MRNNNTQRVKGLPFTVCNVYGQCTAWRTSIAVYDHFSAISRMRHAACNGAVFFDGVGLAPTHVSTSDAPRRPSMVLLVGERSRSLADLLASLPIPASNATSTAVKKHLRTYNGLGYVYPAPHKTSAGIRTPCKLLATPDAASVFFVVCHTSHSMAWCAHLMTNSPQAFDHATAHHAAHNGAMCTSFDGVRSQSLSLLHRTPRRPRMVTLAGQPQGWPVSSNTGSSNPVNVTAPIEIRTSGGDSVNLLLEAAAMVATPTRTRPKFIFRFWSCQNVTYTTTATSEREARAMLPASSSRPVFATRISPLVLVDKKRLPVCVSGLYIPVAGVNPPAGFSSLNMHADNRDDSDMRFFYVRNTTHAPIMAGRSGGSVRARWSRVCQSANPRYALPPRLAARWQGSKEPIHEAATMVNATPCPYPLFIWLFAAVSRADLTDHTPHMVRIAAPDELTARRSLVGRYVLSFAGRIPVQGVRHV
ncbi:host cell division inhibitor Icd-like protein [Salmonella enterica]|nr:host cell division inhibitor Icd-like protein [Salmonella enterica]